MAFINTYFVFDGVQSEIMGVQLIHMSGPMLDSQFFASRELIYDIIPGNNTPYYYNHRLNPFEVTLQIAPINGEWTNDLKSRISKWFNNGKFNEFYSTDDIDRIYILTYKDTPTLNVTGMNEGYIEVTFQNIDCYVRSRKYEKIFDLSNNPTSTTVDVTILGDEKVYSEVWIEKVGNGNLEIRNLSNSGKKTTFTGLMDQEIIYMNGNNRVIETSLLDTLRYDNFNGNYVQFVTGVNRLQVTGGCKIKFAYRYLFLSQ